jgi:hypothetical protein
MPDRIIYILCHDDKSEENAYEIFNKYDWARIYRIPEESQTHLMESVMYTTELMKVYDEWKDATFVGTLSYSILDKLPWYRDSTNFDKIVNQIETMSPLHYDVLGCVVRPNGLCSELPNLLKILTDVGLNTRIINRIIPRYNILKNKVNSYDFEMKFIAHNYWMTTPKIMLDYITFFNQTLLPTMNSHPLIWEDSKYNNNILSKERLRLLSNGKIDYWPFHPMVAELIPRIYFKHLNLRILE